MHSDQDSPDKGPMWGRPGFHTSVGCGRMASEGICGLGHPGCEQKQESERLDWRGDNCVPEAKTRAQRTVFPYILPLSKGSVGRDFSRIHPKWRKARGRKERGKKMV